MPATLSLGYFNKQPHFTGYPRCVQWVYSRLYEAVETQQCNTEATKTSHDRPSPTYSGRCACKQDEAGLVGRGGDTTRIA